MIKWIVQEDLYNESGYARLIDALNHYDQDYESVKVIPFAHELIPDANYSDPVLAMGSTSLMGVSEKKGWKPGIFAGPNFDFRVWRKHLGDLLLNYDAEVIPFGDIKVEGDEVFFCRPIFDFKEFAGTVVDADTFNSWQEKAVAYGDTLNGDTLVIKSTPKRIDKEYRVFVVDGKISTSSQYKVGTRVISDENVPNEVHDFVISVIGIWEPASAYVIDVAKVDDDFKIIEYNCLNSSGFYAADCKKLVKSLVDYVNST